MGSSLTLERGWLQRRAAAIADAPAIPLAVAMLVCVAGIIRFRVFAARRSLWFDEAAVAMNIVERSFRGLLLPLDHQQTAAPLFLWGERVAYLVGGNNEWALRALPLIAGILLPIAMWAVARRLLGDIEGVIAVALVACSPFLIYYANEIKPYGIDALVTLLLVLSALRVEERPDDRSRWLALALGGAVSIGVSIPAPFILAAVAAYLLARPEIRRAPGVTRHATLTALIWTVAAILALLVYLPVMRRDSGIGSFMQHYWGVTFLTTEAPGLKERALTAAAGALRTTFFGQVIWPHQVTMLLLVGVVGFIRVAVTRGLSRASLLGIPLVLLVVAAALKMYPLGDRLILFAAPITALLLAAGITWPARLFQMRWQPVATAFAGALLLAIPARLAWGALRVPPEKSETRRFIEEVVRARSQQSPPPRVWLSAGGLMAWQYYTQSRTGDDQPLKAGVPVLAPDSLGPGLLLGKWWKSDQAKAMDDWAMWEVQRIHVTTGECALMLLAVYEDGERDGLRDAIRRSNLEIVSSHADTGAELMKVCAAGTPSSVTSSRQR